MGGTFVTREISLQNVDPLNRINGLTLARIAEKIIIPLSVQYLTEVKMFIRLRSQI